MNIFRKFIWKILGISTLKTEMCINGKKYNEYIDTLHFFLNTLADIKAFPKDWYSNLYIMLQCDVQLLRTWTMGILLSCMCPKNPEKLVAFWYGKNWRTPVRGHKYIYEARSHYYYIKYWKGERGFYTWFAQNVIHKFMVGIGLR